MFKCKLILPDYNVPDSECRGVVVLVHGLLFRGWFMRPLGRYFARRRYRVFIYDYATTRSSIKKHGERFQLYLRNLVNSISPEIDLHIITHSMGGLLTRWALVDEQLLSRVKSVVMLVPPNSGSPVATNVIQKVPWCKWLVRSLDDLRDAADSSVHRIPQPDIRCLGIIIASNDRLVMADSVVLHGAQYYTVNARHKEILRTPEVRKKCVEFLKNGIFN